jgi:phosphohistidine swiveling domain-containing protein
MKEIDITKIAKMGWTQRWAGSYTFISSAYWGYQYYQSLERVLGTRFDHTLFIHRKGVVAFYMRKDELETLGKLLAEKTVHEPLLKTEWLEELKKNTDLILPIMERLMGKILSWEEYEEFLTVFDRHLPYHVFMKETVDFLPGELLDEILPAFKEARIYSESVYSETEAFFRSVASSIAQKEKMNPEYFTCLTQEEFEAYIKTGVLPKEETLRERFSASALYFEDNQMHLLYASDVDELEKLIALGHTENLSEIKGMIGYKGKAEGRCRIILDPFQTTEFLQGDILVTGMTRPEFMPLMRKAGAIVTDAGGILCHAAITARELQTPCIIGTEIATKVLKDGDMVEVDADKGIVRKLNTNE